MIFTKLHLKNWYSFKDCELDLTYPKKLKIIQYLMSF